MVTGKTGRLSGEGQAERDRAMVGAFDVGKDGSFADGGGEVVRDHEVIDPPAGVAGQTGPVGPPGIGSGLIGVEVAEGVEKAFRE